MINKIVGIGYCLGAIFNFYNAIITKPENVLLTTTFCVCGVGMFLLV